MRGKKLFLLLCLLLNTLSVFAQSDKSEVRSGNRKFKKENYKEAEIDYRRAIVKDSNSVAANYNLSSALYRLEDYKAAGDVLAKINDETAPSQCHYNAGNIALQNKDYATAVKEFRQSLIQDPADIDAKENYIYAKKMLENQQNQDQQDNQDQQNQDNNQQQDQQQNQNQDQQDNQDQNQQQDQQQEPQQGQMTKQQADQLLNAISAKEKATQEKIDKEKAAQNKDRNKEKNW